MPIKPPEQGTPIELSPQPQGWQCFLSQIRKDMRLWCCVVAYLWLFRWLMIVLYHGQLSQRSGWQDLAKCSLSGLRFDASAATYWVLLPLAASLACGFGGLSRFADRIRFVVGVIFLGLTTALCVATVCFFHEYHDQFNHWIFGVILDDRRAIVRTIWAEYHVLLDVVGLGLAVTLGAALLKRILGQTSASSQAGRMTAPSWWVKVLASGLLVVLVIGGARGSFGPRPLQLKDAAVTQDEFLNKLIPNPYYALKFAIRIHQLLNQANGLKALLPDENILAAARRVFPGVANPRDLDECLLKRAGGSPGSPPRHIFVVVMESFDLWPMLPEYQCMGLTPRVSELAKQGVFVRAFVSAADGTMPSLTTLISGLPHVGVFLNYQSSSRQPFPCSAAPIFKRLGYTTRFFYGGYLSWQRIGDFCKQQGFDEVYGGGHISLWGIGREWGVPDADLFRFIAKTVSDDKPSFNLIMSTSYHPPYDLDVYGMGFPLREIPSSLKDRYDGKISLKTFGHLWYADHSLGDFVTAAEKQLSRPLFAITGDHWSRKFINEKPNLLERTGVPCVLYGREVLVKVTPPPRLAGSHIDIVPTLVELSAPAGFQYHSFGGNLLDPQRPAVGFGLRTVVSPDFIFDVGRPRHAELISDQPLAPSSATVSDLVLLHQAKHGLGWWRAIRGNALPKPGN